MTRCIAGMPAALLLSLSIIAAGCSRLANVDGLIAEARQAHGAGDHKTAVIQLKNALQQQEGNAEARHLLGVVYLETGDYRSAEKELRRALDLSGDKARLLPSLARALLGEGEFRKLLDETAGDPDAASAEVLSLRGLAQIGLNESADARRSFAAALAKSPGFPDALVGQARLAALSKDFPGAIALTDQALAKSEKHRDALLLKADLLRLSGEPAQALDAYWRVVATYPDNVAARLNIASLHIAAARYDLAAKEAEEIRRVAPQNPIANYVLALVEFRKQSYVTARDLVLQVLKAAPNHQPSLLLAGATEFALGSYAQSEQYLKSVLDKAPNNLYARKLMAGALLRSRQVVRAIETLQPALRLAPEDAGVLALAGEAHLQNNEYAKAAQYFERAARIDPASAQARTGLGLSRLAAGDAEKAFADLESAVQADGSRYQADLVLVMTAMARGDYARAEKAVASLAKKQPENPLTWNLQAAVLLGRKKNIEARAGFERALALAPGYFPAVMNLAQLDIQEKKPDAARQRLEALLTKEPGHLQTLLALASLAPRIGAGDTEVLDWLERARKSNPAAVQPVILLSRHYLQKGDGKKALEYALDASVAAPDNLEVLDMLGMAQMAAGERNAAVGTYAKLVGLQPRSAGALVRLANAQFVTDNLAAAAGSLRKALELNPGQIEALSALTVIELRQGRPMEALRLATQLQQRDPRAPLGYMLEGDVRMAERKYPAAIAAYDKGLALNRSGPALIKLHSAMTAAGRGDEADARLVAWVRDRPEDQAARLYLADAALKAGKPKIAIEQYEWLLAKQPQNLLVLNNLAWAYSEVKDPRGVRLAEQAHRLKPDSAPVLDTYGWMLVGDGKVEDGLRLLEKAATTAPDQQEIRYHYAAALAKAGKKEQARIELERIVASGMRFAQEPEAVALLGELKK